MNAVLSLPRLRPRARHVSRAAGQPMYAHWSLEDPEDQFGTPA